MKTAAVFIRQKNKRIDKPYDYLVPDNAEAGMRVVLRFGAGGKRKEGFIVQIKESSEFPDKLKQIEGLIDEAPVLSEAQIKLCLFLARRYFCLFYEALGLFTASCPVVKTASGVKAYTYTGEPWLSFEREGRTEDETALKIFALLKEQDYSRAYLTELFPDHTTLLTRMVANKWLRSYKKEDERLTAASHLTPEVRLKINQLLGNHAIVPIAAGTSFKRMVHRNELTKRVLHTVQSLDEDQQLLVLFPDTSKAESFARALANMTGLDETRICYHGKLTRKDKYLYQAQVRAGSIQVVVGTIAAIFLPFVHLTDIIVSDCADSRYTAPGALTFGALSTVRKYAALTGARLLLTDFCNSLVVQKMIADGTCSEIPFESPQSSVQLVCMEDELKNGNFSILSAVLKKEMATALAAGKRCLLLLNRRGNYSGVFCRDCGASVKCPHCGSVLRGGGQGLVCLSCAYTQPVPKTCPSCGSSRIGAGTLGADGAAKYIAEQFPEARLAVLSAEGITGNLESADIIIGTQKLAELRTFRDIGLIAGLLADLDFNYPDYRSEEEAYRLYRSFFDRYPKAIQILQTYQPDAAGIQALGGYETPFFEEQAAYRRSMLLPPYAELFVFTLFGVPAAQLNREAAILAERIAQLARDVSVMPFFNVRLGNAKGLRFTVKAPKEAEFARQIWRLIGDGELEALSSRISINRNPPNIR